MGVELCEALSGKLEPYRLPSAIPPIHRDPFDRMLIAVAQAE